MKKCKSCGKHMDIRVHPYANVYQHAASGEMEAYHLECLVQKIKSEPQEALK